MIESYKTFLKISEKQQLLHNYHNVKITNKPKDVKPSSVVSFSGGKAFCKTSFFSDGAFILFKDRRTGDIIEIYANVDRAKTLLNWQAQFSYQDAIKDAWNWELSNKQKEY